MKSSRYNQLHDTITCPQCAHELPEYSLEMAGQHGDKTRAVVATRNNYCPHCRAALWHTLPCGCEEHEFHARNTQVTICTICGSPKHPLAAAQAPA